MIKLINRLTPQQDKLAHFYWGFIYALISYLIGLCLFDVKYLVFVLPFALGGLKEYIDSRGKGTPEWMDFIFTIVPSIIIYFLL